MPTVTPRDIDVTQREAAARVKIAEAIRDAGLTEVQAVHLLATMLADHTRRLEAAEARELAEPWTRQDVARDGVSGER